MAEPKRRIRTQVDESTLSDLRASLAGVGAPSRPEEGEPRDAAETAVLEPPSREYSFSSNRRPTRRTAPQSAKRTSVSVSVGTHELAKRLTRARMLALAEEQTVGSTYLEGLRLLEERLLEEGIEIPESSTRLKPGPR